MEAQRFIFISCLIFTAYSHNLSIFLFDKERPLVTNENLFTPYLAFNRASSTQLSSSISSYSCTCVLNTADCAHHLQFSEQRPERAFTIEQVSKYRPAKRSRIAPAASYKAFLSSTRDNTNASSRVTCPPSSTFRFNSSIIFSSFIFCFLLKNKKGTLPKDRNTFKFQIMIRINEDILHTHASRQ